MDHPALRLEGCSCTDRCPPLDLVVERGESVLLTGYRSDEGSRLASAIAGLRRPAHGRILVHGTGPSASRPPAGTLILDAVPPLDPSREPVRQLALRASALAGRRVTEAEIRDWIAARGLSAEAHGKVAGLGAGVGRLLTLCLADLLEPSLVVAVEPADGMATSAAAVAASILLGGSGGTGRSVLILSRDARPFLGPVGRVIWFGGDR